MPLEEVDRLYSDQGSFRFRQPSSSSRLLCKPIAAAPLNEQSLSSEYKHSHEDKGTNLLREKGEHGARGNLVMSSLAQAGNSTSTRYRDHQDSRSQESFKELLRVAEAHLSSQQKGSSINHQGRRDRHQEREVNLSNTQVKPTKRARIVEQLQLCGDAQCSSSFCKVNNAAVHCNPAMCPSTQISAVMTASISNEICPLTSPCCKGEHSLPKISPDVIACQDADCLPAIPCEDVRCLTPQSPQATGLACTEPCNLVPQACSIEANINVATSNCPSCDDYLPNYTTFQEMLDCWCCPDHEFEQCCSPDKEQCVSMTEGCNDCCLEETATTSTTPVFYQGNHESSESRSRTTSISISSLGSPGTSNRSYASSISISNTWSNHSVIKQEASRERQSLDCIFEEDHLHNDVGACIPPQMTTYNSSIYHGDTQMMTTAGSLTCHWAGCGMQCHSIADLSNHVNSTHLSLPATSTANAVLTTTANDSWTDQSQLLRCMWDSCQMDQSAAESLSLQSWDDSQIILQHILQAHVGVEEASPQAPVPSNVGKRKVNNEIHHSASTSREASMSAFAEEDNGEHRCAWQECTLCFDNHEALTEHITRDHIGSGKGQYECLWRGCLRGQRVFQQKQKMLRHLQTHTHHRPFVCEVCQKRFSEANTLSQHRRTHTNERPYVCDFPGCKKSFAVAGSLTIHKRIHSGEKPFKCTWPGCTKAFAESSNLAKHHRIHSGARPFSCNIDGCQLSFSRSDQLARHKKTHGKSEDKKGSAI